MNEPIIVNFRVKGHTAEMDYHAHSDFYEIFFFHEGTCKYLVGNHIYDLQPGDILIMDGTFLHKPNVPKNSPYVRSHVHFSPRWIGNLLKEINADFLLELFQKMRHFLIRPEDLNDVRHLEDLMSRLAQVMKFGKTNKKYSTIEAKLLLSEILLNVDRLGKYGRKEVTENKSNKEIHAENIASYIQRNYSRKLTLETIAKDLNLSKSYVSHVFKEITGFTVMEYLQNYRLTQVKLMLEMDSKKTLQEIALDTGFESVSHFSRFFRKHVGMTAGKYRKLRQEKHFIQD